jgi:hypothetical protein
MIICDLCMHYRPDGKCGIDLKVPKGMSCRDYYPGLQKFCANPTDFVNSGQVVAMATFFGMKGTELKKVKLMGANAEKAISKTEI